MSAAKNTVTVSVVTDVATAMRGGSGAAEHELRRGGLGEACAHEPLYASAPTAAQRLAHGASRSNVAVLAAVTGEDDGVVGVE